MEVVGSKGGAALGALAKPRVVATPDALGAEDVEALCEDRVLLPCAAARAVQFGLGAGAGHSRDECDSGRKDSSSVQKHTFVLHFEYCHLLQHTCTRNHKS